MPEFPPNSIPVPYSTEGDPTFSSEDMAVFEAHVGTSVGSAIGTEIGNNVDQSAGAKERRRKLKAWLEFLKMLGG